MQRVNPMMYKGIFWLFIFLCYGVPASAQNLLSKNTITRERISVNEDWHFYKYATPAEADNLIYDVRPIVTDGNDDKAADSRPTEATKVETQQEVLKPWILPTAN